MILKFLRDQRVKRIKGLWKRATERADLFEREYVKERNKRMLLESVALSEIEKEYIKLLIKSDQVINSHKHTSHGLYSEFDEELFDFTSSLLIKISKM